MEISLRVTLRTQISYFVIHTDIFSARKKSGSIGIRIDDLGHPPTVVVFDIGCIAQRIDLFDHSQEGVVLVLRLGSGTVRDRSHVSQIIVDHSCRVVELIAMGQHLIGSVVGKGLRRGVGIGESGQPAQSIVGKAGHRCD